jgi:hypothetical protein
MGSSRCAGGYNVPAYVKPTNVVWWSDTVVARVHRIVRPGTPKPSPHKFTNPILGPQRVAGTAIPG